MSTHEPDRQRPDMSKPAAHQKGRRRHSSGWIMLACGIPLIIALFVLAATGVLGFGFGFAAIACLAMMALMMRGMGGSGGGRTQ
ncbi:hypothetical protein ACWC2K_33715 [Streptomyces chattanoogensis]|uniref:hypothetical protein n=1 Tax=Streptomyces chattanoogensis TaxID=66876 RepID=UPI003688AD67